MLYRLLYSKYLYFVNSSLFSVVWSLYQTMTDGTPISSVGIPCLNSRFFFEYLLLLNVTWNPVIMESTKRFTKDVISM